MKKPQMLFPKKIKKVLMVAIMVFVAPLQLANAQKATIKEEGKSFKTYGFSDPNPVPSLTYRNKIYPYFRFDGYSHTAKEQSWNVVTLENEYLQVTVLPEIGGKVWGAIEKSTGEDFIYNNEVVKFRNIAMRGPWTSGGIEFNFGLIGHTPATATPVDYILMENEDGSVSCVVGAIDLPSRTQWRVKINLPHNKAYFETIGQWYNPTPIHTSYYNWMTAAARASDDLEFFYPGNHALAHSGESTPWPYDEEGRKIAMYKNNNFGGNRSYHMAGSYDNFFGGYFHDKNIGFCHWAPYDEMPGKKLWIWALSRSGGIWEDLLTDRSGQYIEFQAGRMLNQFHPSPSNPTPLSDVGFEPYTFDKWTDFWFPVKDIGGISSASSLGSVNVEKNGSRIDIRFNSLVRISDEIKVLSGDKVIYRSHISMNPLEVFTQSLNVPGEEEKLQVFVGPQRIFFTDKQDPYQLGRPFTKDGAHPSSAADNLYNEGRQSFWTRNYTKAMESFEACLKMDPGHQGARIRYAELLYRNALYEKALENIHLALVNDYYDFDANYTAGIIYKALAKPFDALEALGWAARSMQFRSAAFAIMSEIYLGMDHFGEAERYARQSLEFNIHNLNAQFVLAVTYRITNNATAAKETTDTMIKADPLNHLARFEKYLLSRNGKDLEQFSSLIRNEMPYQTYLELAMDYLRLNRQDEAIEVLSRGPSHPLVDLWLAYLNRSDPAKSDLFLSDAIAKSPEMVFPFREETLAMLMWANQKSSNWKLKYYLGLNLWAKNRNDEASALFKEIGNRSDYAPFYLARTALLESSDQYDKRKDLERAQNLDNNQWRIWVALHQYLDEKKLYEEQLSLASKAYKKFKGNHMIEMAYAQALLNNKKYDQCRNLLGQINVLPYENAREGRTIYEQAYLFSALEDISKRNYAKARSNVLKSLEWPESLGVGKPYEFDRRRQDYLLAYISHKTKNKEGIEKHLRQILENSKSMGEGYSLNELLKLKAMDKQGVSEGIEKTITGLQGSNAPSAKWVVNYWKKGTGKMDEMEHPDNTDFVLFSEILRSTSDF